MDSVRRCKHGATRSAGSFVKIDTFSSIRLTNNVTDSIVLVPITNYFGLDGQVDKNVSGSVG